MVFLSTQVASPPARPPNCLVIRALERWLRSRLGDPADYVHVSDAVGLSRELACLHLSSPEVIVEAVKSCPAHGPVELDAAGESVRLRGVLERLHAALDEHFADPRTLRAEELPTLLQNVKPIASILDASTEYSDQLAILANAVRTAPFLKFCGEQVVLRWDAVDSTSPEDSSTDEDASVLVTKLDHDDVEVRASAATQLSNMDSAAVAVEATRLAKLLEHSDAEVRKLVCQIMGSLKPSMLSAHADVIVGKMLVDENDVRDAAIIVAGKLPRSLVVESVVSYLSHSNWEVRQRALESLMTHPCSLLIVHVAVLADALADEATDVQRAAHCLWEKLLGDQEHMKLHANKIALLLSHQEAAVRQVACVVINNYDVDVLAELVDVFSKEMSNDDVVVRNAVSDWMSRLLPRKDECDQNCIDEVCSELSTAATTANVASRFLPHLETGLCDSFLERSPPDVTDDCSQVCVLDSQHTQPAVRIFAKKDVRAYRVCRIMAEMLSHSAEVVHYIRNDGSARIQDMFLANPLLAHAAAHNINYAWKAIASCRSRVTQGPQKYTVRFLPYEDSIRFEIEHLCENLLSADHEMLLSDFCHRPPVHEILISHTQTVFPDPNECLSVLHRALLASDVLELEDTGSLENCKVRWRTSLDRLRIAVERVLTKDRRASLVLRRDGEIALSWLAAHPDVRKVNVGRAQKGNDEATLHELRQVFSNSTQYALDEFGVSARVLGIPPALSRPEDNNAARKKDVPWKCNTVSQKDVKLLRDLLRFYFTPFNLQHNKVLMAIVEGQRQRGLILQRSGDNGCMHVQREESMQTAESSIALAEQNDEAQPIFLLNDLCVLPRIGRILNKYESSRLRILFDDVLEGTGDLPIRLCTDNENQHCVPHSAASLKLTYEPNLRYIEANSTQADILDAIRTPDSDPVWTPKGLPSHAICVISYSVSSDLSHGESPKAHDVQAEVISGKADPNVLTWNARQQKIVRQVKHYNADIICIQGLQSIGHVERCSESEPNWFCCDEEPASNHLVNLYRDLSKENYGVVFAPTMKMPGSSTLCFGNAIFWKRTRWTLDKYCGLFTTAVCAKFESKWNGTPVQVCSAKAAAAYAQEWGDHVTKLELSQALLSVGITLSQSLSSPIKQSGSDESNEVRPVPTIWCGDFGFEPQTLLSMLATVATAGVNWHSALAVVCKRDAWSCFSKFVTKRAVDGILFHSFVVEAVLGGLQKDINSPDLIKAGFPSDHLLQMAVFTWEKEPRMDSQGDQQTRKEDRHLPRQQSGSQTQQRWKTVVPTSTLIDQHKRWRPKTKRKSYGAKK